VKKNLVLSVFTVKKICEDLPILNHISVIYYAMLIVTFLSTLYIELDICHILIVFEKIK
jgi:hypothetical protein